MYQRLSADKLGSYQDEFSFSNPLKIESASSKRQEYVKKVCSKA